MNEKLILINKNTLESLEETNILKIIEKFTKTGIEILSADFGFMFWKLENQDSYQLVYTSPETPYQPRLPRKRGYNYKASVGRIPYFVSKPKKNLLPYMKSLVIIPIFYKDHQYGNIVICFKKNRIFTKEEEPLTIALGNSAAQILTIYRTNKKIQRDSLRLLRQKDEFFNMVSHELKTPITTIKGFSQILIDKLQNSDIKTKYFLEKINSQVDKLVRLINDLLDISRIRTGKLKFEKGNFELQKLIKQVIESLRVTIISHPIYFANNDRFWLRGDSERIEGVIINLVANAAKYSPSGSKINVSLKKKGGYACIEVEDFGYGIPKGDRGKIFNRFFQGKASSKKGLSGLGLGLYIANSIVKAHGGKLDFRPKKFHKGTIFYLNLPYYKYRKARK